MRAYYEITTALKNQLDSQQINIIKLGDMADVDLDKQGIYPLAHILIEEARMGMQTIEFDINILFADLVDINTDNKKEGTPFYGNNNHQDIMNAMLNEANILTQHLMRGNLFASNYQVINAPTALPFTGRFKNLLSGWMLSFTVQVPNIDTTIC